MGVLLVLLFIGAIILAEELYKRKPKTKGISGALNWHIRKGVLYIDGNGPMENFSTDRRSPWHQKITGVVIGSGVTSVGDYAFSFCTYLTEVIVPSNVKSIGRYAFSYCIGLKSVDIQNSPDRVKIGSGVFPAGTEVKFTQNGHLLHSYTVKDYEEEVISAVPEAAEEEIIVPENTAETQTAEASVSAKNETITWNYTKSGLVISGKGPMDDYSHTEPAPWGTDPITVIIEPGITSIGKNAFYNCTKLTSVTIPDSVESIEEKAFAWCASLQSVTLPVGLKKLGGGAFSCCSKLSSINLPASLAEIPDDAFAYCDKLRSKLRKMLQNR